MTFDIQKARMILSDMSPLPWIVLEDENGQMTIIRNPDHPMHRDGMADGCIYVNMLWHCRDIMGGISNERV